RPDFVGNDEDSQLSSLHNTVEVIKCIKCRRNIFGILRSWSGCIV
ncbi:MAG: hypothetical protein UY87_C0095G0008, partial [Candidatus Peribacteria bacterium GW2011_GWC2_54_8]